MAKYASVLTLLTSLGLLIGCGGKDPMAANLSGTVTYNGKPVKGGNIMFITQDHGTVNTTIASDGGYSVKLPAESMAVTIETESVNPGKNTPVYGGAKNNPGGGENKFKSERMKAEGKSGDAQGQSFGPPPVEELAKLYTKIPSKYAHKETSGLTLQLEPGKQVKNFELTD